MAGNSGSKNGVASLAYAPAIHALPDCEDVDARHKAGHDVAARCQRSLRKPSSADRNRIR